MNAEEARTRVAEMIRQSSAGRLQDAEDLCSSVISGLPRSGEGAEELYAAYDWLVGLRWNQRRTGRALRVFRQYVEDCAPRCDPAYDQAYYDALVATGTSPAPLRRRLRFHSLVQLLREALPIEGLVAECGCYRGLSSHLLCSTLKSANAGFDGGGYRIFDSFQGLSAWRPEDTIEDTSPDADMLRRLGPGHFAASVHEVKAALAGFPRIEFFPGWIPQAFPDELGARYRFVHVDVDLYQPTRDSLEYFYPRLATGGILVCDDYNWPGARKAIESFCAGACVALETTPRAQAVLRKT
jgi:O-methyltransferase